MEGEEKYIQEELRCIKKNFLLLLSLREKKPICVPRQEERFDSLLEGHNHSRRVSYSGLVLQPTVSSKVPDLEDPLSLGSLMKGSLSPVLTLNFESGERVYQPEEGMYRFTTEPLRTVRCEIGKRKHQTNVTLTWSILPRHRRVVSHNNYWFGERGRPI